MGNTPYLPVSVNPVPTYEPSDDELAPIPRAGENLDASVSATTPSIPKPPPYSWTQTSDSLTIAIPLPADTPTSRIRVGFAPGTLTVRVDGAPPGTPRYVLRPLWGAVRADACVWTFDRAAERLECLGRLLGVHLQQLEHLRVVARVERVAHHPPEVVQVE